MLAESKQLMAKCIIY